MIVKANPAGILGTGHCVPDQVWTNKDLEKMMDTSDEWIRSRTGIGARHVAPKGVNTSDLATKAGEEALKNAGIKAEDLNLIIVCTLTPDRALPSTACKVQANLHAVNAAAFDLEAACSGFAYGSIIASQFIENKMYKYISYELKERRQDAAQVLYHKQDLPEEVKAYKQPVSTEELLAGVTLSRMHRIFVDIIRRQNNRIDPIRSTFGTLQKEEVDMDQMREKVAEYIEQHEVCNFRELLLGQATKMQVIIAFLIILEMMKEGVITIVQEESFGEIHIAKNKTDESGS